jgi:hypothetical protein
VGPLTAFLVLAYVTRVLVRALAIVRALSKPVVRLQESPGPGLIHGSRPQRELGPHPCQRFEKSQLSVDVGVSATSS